MKVTLVVPVKDESGSIIELLRSIEAQTLRPDETLLVDGGSTDATPEIVDRWAAGEECRLPVRVIRTLGAMPGRGRNRGIAEAGHTWVCLTDAGIRLEPHWLQRLVEAAEGTQGVDVVYGNYEPIIGSFFDRCASLVYVPPKENRGGGAVLRGPSIASCLMRRSVWEAVGGFPDFRASEDLVFIDKVKHAGFRTAWAPRATVHWRLQPTLGRTFRKFRLYSTHNVWAGRQYDWHHGVARTYLFAFLFLFPAALHSAWWLLGLVTLAAMRVAKSIWCRADSHRLAALLNPMIFLAVAGIMLTVDLAMFVGWVEALTTPCPSAPSGETADYATGPGGHSPEVRVL